MNIDKLVLSAMVIGLFAGGASAAEPIEGQWKDGSVEVVAIKACGDSFCLTMTTGKYAGQSIGKLKGKGQDYAGEITDPGNKKTYSGSGTVEGKTLKLTGCALKIFCRTEEWSRL
ncbi:DUF2147 domain-containing protein [Rhizobium sp.]|jgi:uncharacterized protein (DUF2147 family)|uniref:DUF2147 domain-containing protein n=1 Tax=Rhizobium sp. TaxID=391 RepID=UPI000E9840A0|nr:DUF2147 domain-containing protein [Rhizobium sp.]